MRLVQRDEYRDHPREIREWLDHELQGVAYQELLARLQKTGELFRCFNTWADVITFMREGTSDDPRKNQILHLILEAHIEDQDSRWRAILLRIFWPGLVSIHSQKRHWDPDQEARWQNVVWTFLEIICRLDPRKRPERLVQKIFNDTIHHLHDEYLCVWGKLKLLYVPNPFEHKELLGKVTEIDMADIELREAREIEINRLKVHLEAGRISEADFLLLVGTKVYRKSLADHARHIGLNYEVAKKRHQRAKAAIRRAKERGK